jgi:two-component system chemotaxis response regulator CheY
MRFLVVDDVPMMRRAVCGLLLDIGWHAVAEAVDGAAALSQLRSSAFDFVVTDINMPRLNGYELLQEIRADAALSHLPVLIVVPEAREEDFALAAQCGASGVIVRPFSKAALRERVQRIVLGMAAPA